MDSNHLEQILDEVDRQSTSAGQPKPLAARPQTIGAVQHHPNRILAKARIQKSIRFLPNLIARLETYCTQLELQGKTPPSIQSIQNEALALWLDRHESTSAP